MTENIKQIFNSLYYKPEKEVVDRVKAVNMIIRKRNKIEYVAPDHEFIP